jgi:type VI secretion system protein ImpL
VKKLLKILLYALIWMVLAAVIVGIMIFMGESWVTGAQIAVILFVIWILFMIIKRAIVRHRAKQRVSELIATTEETAENEPKTESVAKRIKSQFSDSDPVNQQFNKFEKLLKTTALKKQGDPLYVLPWYLMVGMPGSGKSSALSHADLSAPLFDEKQLGDEGGIRWWPYNEAIIVEAPGRYFSPEDLSGDGEWHTYLKTTEKRRRKEPLNGIIMTLDVEYLINARDEELFEAGRLHQARLDKLMKMLRIKIPVYLLITKCDRIEGFVEFSQTLPDDSFTQATGFAREEDDGPAEDFILHAIDETVETIKDHLINSLSDAHASHRLLRLPKGLNDLKSRLTIFARGGFQTNPYQEPLFLRGVYFSAIEMDKDADADRQSFFLQDFFTQIVPADRTMISSLTTVEHAQRATRRMVMGGWSLFMIALIGAVTWLYYGNLQFIERTRVENAGAFVMKETLREKVEALRQLTRMIEVIEHETSTWIIPWYGIMGKPDFVKKLETIYAERFNSFIMRPLNEELNTALIKAELDLREAKGDQQVQNLNNARQIDTFVRRLTVLRSFLDGAAEDELAELPAPFVEGGLYFPAGTTDDFMQTFNALYLQSLIWTPDRSLRSEELAWLNRQLNDQLSKVSKDMAWLIPLANEEANRQDFTDLTFFWPGSGAINPAITIPGAYTLLGKEFVEGFIDRLIAIDPGSGTFKEMQELFTKAYRTDYINTWKEFALQFDQGTKSLRGRNEWVDLIDLIPTRHNPYFKALDVFIEQLEPFSEDENTPEWVDLVMYYERMKLYDPTGEDPEGSDNKALTKLALKTVGKLGPVGKAISKGGKTAVKTQKKTGIGSKSAAARDMVLEDAGQTLIDYKNALTDISFNASSRAVSMRAIIAYFSNPDEPGAGDGPEARAYNTIRKLESLIGKNTVQTKPFWALYGGTLDTVRLYMLSEASCLLQTAWEQTFLVEVEGVPQFRRGNLMFGDNGQLWRFINERASAFMVRQPGKGYVPRVVNGLRMPLEPDFINFVYIGLAAKNQEEKQETQIKVPTLITKCWN